MTISPPEREPYTQRAPASSWPFTAESRLTFTMGPEISAAEAMERASAMVAMTLPRFLAGTPDAEKMCAVAQAVLTELIDVTARHRASDDLVGHVVFDGAHVTLSVGDMSCLLPPPAEEPGLYLVHRLAVDSGQYSGDHGGRVTWAAVAT